MKTATVNIRIQEDIKQQAEKILEQLGISRAVAIEMYYRQIINHKGIPFALTLPPSIPARSEMDDSSFNQMMEEGLRQADAGAMIEADAFFDHLLKERSL